MVVKVITEPAKLSSKINTCIANYIDAFVTQYTKTYIYIAIASYMYVDVEFLDSLTCM